MTDQQQSFDAASYKIAQRDQWNKDAAAWHQWNPALDRWVGNVTKVMLDMAMITTGQRVLDIAAGAGEPALSAATRVGPEGYVLATDIAEEIIQLAQKVADERGIKHIETRVMDGESLDLDDATFDAVICRLGLMYMPHPVAALSEWHRVLKPGGRVGIVVFSTPDRNGWGMTPVSIIRQRAQLPPPVPGQPGPFSLGADGVLESAFQEAGFAKSEIKAVPAPLQMSDIKEYMNLAQEAFGAFNAMMAHLSSQERQSVWAEVEEAMREFETPDGFNAPGECLVAVATK